MFGKTLLCEYDEREVGKLLTGVGIGFVKRGFVCGGWEITIRSDMELN